KADGNGDIAVSEVLTSNALPGDNASAEIKATPELAGTARSKSPPVADVVEPKTGRPAVKVKPLASAEVPEYLDEPVIEQAPKGWRAKAAAMLAKALGREEQKTTKATPKRKRAPRKKVSASTDGVSAKPRAKRKPRAKVQPKVKKGLFGRVLARIGLGDEEPVAAPKPRRRKATPTEGRTAPRKPRAASAKKRASKKAPAKKSLFGRVMARLGMGQEEAPVRKPRVRKPVDPNAPKKPRKPRATSTDGAPKRKRGPAKKAKPKTALQRAVDSVVGGWRNFRGK
ncbi:MAG: hypothetical protein ACPGSC_11590, partial [Granulosicoccaceae bacterium]